MPENNATLKKKNQELGEQVNALSEEIRKLKEHVTEHTSSPDRSAAQATETALQFYSMFPYAQHIYQFCASQYL